MRGSSPSRSGSSTRSPQPWLPGPVTEQFVGGYEPIDLLCVIGVFDNAASTSDSPFLAGRLEQLLDRHDPDMVIVMMGINDPFYFSEADERLNLQHRIAEPCECPSGQPMEDRQIANQMLALDEGNREGLALVDQRVKPALG